MLRKKRDYGAGSIDQRGEDTWRLRYRIGAERFGRARSSQSSVMDGLSPASSRRRCSSSASRPTYGGMICGGAAKQCCSMRVRFMS
jgi:hypothetical protein